jgi:predicted peroxiredoxin
MGQEVSIFLTMDGTVWATRGAAKGVEVAGFEPLSEYIDGFRALGGQMLVCAPCSEYYCSFDPEANPRSLIDGAQLSGLATIVSKIGAHTRAMTL